MSRLQIVEMRLAYAWTCESCGRENFEHAVVHEFSPEETAELKRDAGVDDAQTGNWMSHPDHVTCKACSAEFGAKHFRADQDSVLEQGGE